MRRFRTWLMYRRMKKYLERKAIFELYTFVTDDKLKRFSEIAKYIMTLNPDEIQKVIANASINTQEKK